MGRLFFYSCRVALHPVHAQTARVTSARKQTLSKSYLCSLSGLIRILPVSKSIISVKLFSDLSVINGKYLEGNGHCLIETHLKWETYENRENPNHCSECSGTRPEYELAASPLHQLVWSDLQISLQSHQLASEKSTSEIILPYPL